jgi:hypothetical protein
MICGVPLKRQGEKGGRALVIFFCVRLWSHIMTGKRQGNSGGKMEKEVIDRE